MPSESGVHIKDRADGKVQFFAWSAIYRVDYDFAP